MNWIRALPNTLSRWNKLIGRNRSGKLLSVFLLLVISFAAGSSEGSPRPSSSDTLTRWYQCGVRLLHLSGKTTDAVLLLPALYRDHSVEKDPEFLEFLMAVIFVESRFDRNARSTSEAYGLMQLTTVAMIESSRECNLRRIRNMPELHDSGTNIRYGSCYLKKLLKEQGGDLDRALIIYNGGYKQLLKYDAGLPIVSETANYVIQIRRALSICRESPTDLP